MQQNLPEQNYYQEDEIENGLSLVLPAW